jgi:hypothetical protein
MQRRFDSEYKKLYAVIIGQCTEYMIAKLKGIPSFKTIHTDKDSLALLKMIKGLVFRFDDKLYKMYQTREMTNVQFRDKFNSLIDVIKHYGGTDGVHKKVTEQFLALYTDGIYEN